VRAYRASSKRTRSFAVLLAVAAIAAIASTAWAVIPDASGTIHACVARDGALRVIDTDLGETCKPRETSLEWDTTPETRLPDSFVALATDEVSLPDGRTEIARLNLQPGRYQVSAKVFLFSTSSTFVPGSGVACQLTPSSSDGTPGDPGAPPADPGLLVLSASGEPGSAGTISLAVSQTLTLAGAVVLSCASHDPPADSAPVASNAWIRAIEVGSITPEPPPPPLP
jgi:hypothetical protein